MALLRSGAAAAMVMLALALAHHAHSAPKNQKYKRIKPDTSKLKTGDIFFEDVFRDALEGTRPANLGGGANGPGGGTPSSGTPAGGTTPAPMGNEYAWSKIVTAETLEDEIKRINFQLDQDVSTPSEFNARGHKMCRQHFSLLGMLFAIISEYDGDVRWKDEAAEARALFSHAGLVCKAATPNSYKEAKFRKTDLADMVRGARLQSGSGDAPAETDWERTCERSQLMKRIDAANLRLRELTADKGAFQSGADDVTHEAQMLAAIAEAMKKPGMPDGEDDDYQGFCDSMKDSALEIVEAVKQKSAEAASTAVGNINRACNDCHEIYRG